MLTAMKPLIVLRAEYRLVGPTRSSDSAYFHFFQINMSLCRSNGCPIFSLGIAHGEKGYYVVKENPRNGTMQWKHSCSRCHFRVGRRGITRSLKRRPLVLVGVGITCRIDLIGAEPRRVR